MHTTLKTPFVHRFQTNSQQYIFDVNTLFIVKVDPVIWDIIESVGPFSVEEAVKKYNGRWEEAQVRTAYEEILTAQKMKGVFLPHRPEVKMYWSEEDVKARFLQNREILILNVTDRCNFACAYCANNTRNLMMKPKSSDMSWQTAKAAIDDFMRDAKPEHRSVTFYGGEPLLNFGVIKKCVNYVRAMDDGEEIYLGLTTNGSLLTDEIADFFSAQGVSISVSMDGPKELHDRYRRTKGGGPTWDLVAKNVKRYCQRHPSHAASGKFGLSVVVCPPLDVTEFRDAMKELFISPDLIITLNEMDGRYSGFDVGESVGGYESLRQEYLLKLRNGAMTQTDGKAADRVQRLLFERSFLFRHRRHELYACRHGDGPTPRLPDNYYFSSSSCVPGTRRTFVNADGDLWPCERICHTDYLRIGSLATGLDTAKIRQLLADWVDLNRGDCENCWCLHGCQVGCFANVACGNKPTAEVKRAACQSYRERSHSELVEYCSILEENPQAMDFLDKVTIS